jgi:hypothetical protein
VVSRWGEHGSRPTPLGTNDQLFARIVVHPSVHIAGTAAAAWALVADVTRIGEFSPECCAARWTGSNPGPHVGARFEGTNHIFDGGDDLTWIRPCTVVVAQSGESFGYVVGDRYDGSPASHWLYEIHSSWPGNCRIDLTFRHVPGGLSGLRLRADADPEHAAQIVAARTADLAAGMRTTLARMKSTLEKPPGSPR